MEAGPSVDMKIGALQRPLLSLASRAGAGHSTRAILTALLVAALLPAWAFGGYAAWRQFEAERSAHITDAREVARSLSILVDRELATLRAGMAAAAAVIEGTGNAALLQDLSASFTPVGGHLALLDESELPERTADPVQAFARTALSPAAGHLPILSGLLPAESGTRPLVAMAQRVPGPGPRRVLLLTTDALRHWSATLRQGQPEEDWIVALADAGGTIIARIPDPVRHVGESITEPARAALRAGAEAGQGEGVARSRSREGRSTYLTWRRLSADPWAILIGVPADGLDAPIWRAIPLYALVGLVVMAGFTLFLGWWTERRLVLPLAALGRVARAFGQGEVVRPPRRSGVREVDQAGEALVIALGEFDRNERRLRESEARFRILAEATPQIVLSARPDGLIEYVNPRFRTLTGLDPEILSTPGARALHPADRPRAVRAWRRVLRRGVAATTEFRLRRAGGGWIWVSATALPSFGPEGTVERIIAAAGDVTDLVETREALARQVAAEAAARRAALDAAAALAASEERFRRFAEASPDVLLVARPEGRELTYVSPAAAAIWGRSVDEIMETPDFWQMALHPEDRFAAAAVVADSAARGEPVTFEYRILRPDGSVRWIRDTAFSIPGRPGEPARVGGLARDITHLRSADSHRAMLLAELNHRVKNTLVTVQSLMTQTARTAALAPDPMGRFTADFQGRILALSRAHDLLTATTWRGSALIETVEQALAPWRGPGRDAAQTSRVVLGGPDVWLLPRQALGLSMALHELATNAAKHGALSVPSGSVRIGWTLDEDEVRLSWQEDGGPPVTPPSRRGFGSRLLERGLSGELGPGASITLDYCPQGFHAEILFRAQGRRMGEDSA
ncbi:PAS domain-containing protein [Muricoccus radiodurans]|uniref:PAS domain-containing protein n=1 Tax=Muricoccus radiodurans TaxID=2231721 RepID=UPI003CEFF750